MKPLRAATKKKILAFLKRGVPRRMAALGAGESYDTFKAWMLAGVQPGAKDNLRDFAVEIYAIETELVAKKLDLLEELGAEDSRAIALFFQLRFPKGFEDDSVDAIDAKPAKEATLVQALRKPSPKMLAAIREAGPSLLALLAPSGIHKRGAPDPALAQSASPGVGGNGTRVPGQAGEGSEGA